MPSDTPKGKVERRSPRKAPKPARGSLLLYDLSDVGGPHLVEAHEGSLCPAAHFVNHRNLENWEDLRRREPPVRTAPGRIATEVAPTKGRPTEFTEDEVQWLHSIQKTLMAEALTRISAGDTDEVRLPVPKSLTWSILYKRIYYTESVGLERAKAEPSVQDDEQRHAAVMAELRALNEAISRDLEPHAERLRQILEGLRLRTFGSQVRNAEVTDALAAVMRRLEMGVECPRDDAPSILRNVPSKGEKDGGYKFDHTEVMGGEQKRAQHGGFETFADLKLVPRPFKWGSRDD